MKPLNLREYAESLALTDNREFALEILENLDFVETANFEELCENLTLYSEKEFKNHDPIKQIERIGDRLDLLDEIKDTLDSNGFKSDADDVVKQLVETDLALRSLLKLDATGDIFETVAQLLENQKPKEYDL